LSREDIVAVASRIFAIFILVFELRVLAQLVELLSTNTFAPGALATLTAVLLAVLATAALLWFFPLTVARKLLPVMKEPRSEPAVGVSTAFSLALTIMGMWFLGNAIVDVAYWLMLFAHVHGSDMRGFELTPSQEGSIAATVVRLMLSFWLIFGSSGINRIITRARYGSGTSDAL
jgi:hypothetical protein